MNITSKKLTSEIQKCLGSFEPIAHERTHKDNAVYSMVSTGKVSDRVFNTIIEKITNKLTNHEFIQDFLIVYKKNLIGKPIDGNIYVYTYNNKEEKKTMIRDNMSIELEGILLLQKEILDRKQKLVDVSNELLKVQNEVQ